MYRKYSELTVELIFNLERGLTALYDGFLYDPVGLVDINMAGGFADLQPFLARKGADSWAEVLPIFRSVWQG